MAKFLVILVILIVIGGVVFFFGWIQFQLPENTYAVIFTKTGGWDSQVIEPGKFIWRWERLIPTNLKLHKYSLAAYSRTISSIGTLPSANLYSQILEPHPDFEYSIEIFISCSLKPEYLPTLASEHHALPDTIDQWYSDYVASMVTGASTILADIAGDPDFRLDVFRNVAEFELLLKERIADDYQEINIHALSIRDIKLPDIELYRIAKEQYLILAFKRQEAREIALEETARATALTEQQFLVLERYGDLLDRYPDIMQILTLDDQTLSALLLGIRQ